MAFFDLFRKKQDKAPETSAAERQTAQEQLSAGLEKTKTGLFSKLARTVAGRSKVDAEVLDDLEEVLITSDRKSTRLNSSHTDSPRMPSSA